MSHFVRLTCWKKQAFTLLQHQTVIINIQIHPRAAFRLPCYVSIVSHVGMMEPFARCLRVEGKPTALPERELDDRPPDNDDSISGASANLFFAKDDSLAALLLNHGIKVRDFILLSFLSDQGPMSILRLARVVGIEPAMTLRSLRRLSAASLVLREPVSTGNKFDSIARLTSRGEDIAGRISEQIE